MAWETESEFDDAGRESVFAWDHEKGRDTKTRVFRIDKAAKLIEYFPKGDFVVPVVHLEGFTAIPDEFNAIGYMKQGMDYYVGKKFSSFDVESLTISKTAPSGFRKVRGKDAYRVVLHLGDLRSLREGLTNISNESKLERSGYVDEHFQTVFPSRFPPGTRDTARRRAARIIRNLDESVIEKFDQGEVEQLMDFFAMLLDKRYSSSASRQKLFRAAKIKVDSVTLSDTIAKFERYLEEDVPEATWGKFLRENLFLVESKYVAVVPELNVVLGSERRVDFGLVDSDGFLDLYEIKKKSTKLLAANMDRGNYYWHSDATKALVQAEKYLYNADRKANDLAVDIKRERGVDVRVVRPKAVVVLGSSDQLVNDKQREDFKVLRESLKNVDVILYDELLTRLQNQQGRLVGQPELSTTA